MTPPGRPKGEFPSGATARGADAAPAPPRATQAPAVTVEALPGAAPRAASRFPLVLDRLGPAGPIQ